MPLGVKGFAVGEGNPRHSHGMSKTPLYKVWKDMHARCANTRRADWKNYGGRGIKVCDRWSDFSAFFEDMGVAYAAGLTLERQDNSDDYGPENCVWADRVVQNRNQRKTVLSAEKARRIRSMRADGMQIKDIAREMKAPMGAISNVLYGHAWKGC